MRVERKFKRGRALQYVAAWDVRRGHVRGRCDAQTGIESFGRLVEQLMRTEPYRSANRVFWLVVNGSSHRGQTAVQRLRKAYRKAVLVRTPLHPSWLNQVEIYFSIIQRKVLIRNDFASLDDVEQPLLLYEELSNREPHRLPGNSTASLCKYSWSGWTSSDTCSGRPASADPFVRTKTIVPNPTVNCEIDHLG